MKSLFKSLLMSLLAFITLLPMYGEGDGGFVGGLQVQVVQVSSAGTVTVDIESSSLGGLRIWDEGNSWGAARWRIILVRNGRVETFFQNPFQIFTANVPTFKEIAKGAHIRRDLNLNAGNWCGLGHCSRWDEHGLGGNNVTFLPGDTVFVVYDVPPSKEAVKMHVWYGVAAAFTTVPKSN